MKRQNIRKLILIVSLLLFPVTLNFFSPYLIIQGASEGVVTGSFLLFLTLFLTSLVFGRAFCGWVCPSGALQEVLFAVNNRKGPSGKANWIKYLIWLPWISAVFGIGLGVAGGFKAVNPLYMTETGISTDEPLKYITYYMVVLIFFALSVFFGRRAGCHTICWMAPFMVIGTKIQQWLRLPALHLAPNPSACTHCQACTRHCPMSLGVHEMVQKGDMRNTECILCGECADGCTHNAIRLTWKKS